MRIASRQRKVISLVTLTPDFSYKNLPPKTIREFEVFEREPLVLLAQSCDKIFSASNSDILVCLASLFIRHMNTIW